MYTPELRNTNLHNVTHSLISWNRREQMFLSSNLAPYCHIISLISQFFSLMQTTEEVNPYSPIAPCVNMWSVTFLFSFFLVFLYDLLNVGACISHTAHEDQVEWTTPHQ